jgi:NAD(P)-dependent dehydrogenase (short-subunit alcohol dehydrogenase family)
VSWLGGLDVLVNSAGVGGVGAPVALADLELEAWRTTIDTNLTGTYLITRFALPHLVAAGGAAIVNHAATYAAVAGPKLGAYSASKGGIVALTKNVAVDYAAAGVRANALAPGFVDTPMLRADIAKEPDPDAALAAILERIPQGMLMTPEQVARVIVFLASDDAAVLTGALVVADGGYTAL